MLITAPSHCYIVKLDTFPGIWRMAADLMCELKSVFYFFSMGKWGLVKVWWRSGEEFSRVRIRSFLQEAWSQQLYNVGPPSLKDINSQCCCGGSLLFFFSRKLDSSKLCVSFWWMLKLLPLQLVGSVMPQKGASQMATPTLQYQVTLEAWGAQALTWNAT